MRSATLLDVADPIDFARLYRDGVERVWRVVRRLGVASGDVEDAVQDVFLIAHRRLHTLRPDVAPAAWLTGIAVRVAHDYRRRGARKPVDGEASKGLPDAGVLPDEQAARRDAFALAMRLLEHLPGEQRDVFVLAEFEQLSAPEIAQITEAPLNTVYSRLRLARARFNELVAGLEPSHE